MGDDLSYGLNTLGPLCLCLYHCLVLIQRKIKTSLKMTGNSVCATNLSYGKA